MTKILNLEKTIKKQAVFWDGSFQSVRAIRKAGVFNDMQVSFWEGRIAYIDKKGELCSCSRNRWLLRKGNEVIEFVSETDITNQHYKIV
ncbi:MAG: hypothetical protein KJI69_05200 [Patescibacteria group bacterium]|nr:hypothetical protein [Patescibacteria group bacterium]